MQSRFNRRRAQGAAHVIVWCVSLFCTSVVEAGEIHVYEGQSIQDAIDGASDGDEIIVHPGTYYECIDFLGRAISLRSSDGPGVTTIDATGLNDTVVRCVSGE